MHGFRLLQFGWNHKAMVLLKVKHRNICPYEELFIIWDNTVIQMFFGQMVDVLVYLHQQNIFHRNLKPSNILLDGEASFMLCDFSSETLMTDEMKWKIRVEEAPDHKSWMAPEALKFSFSDKSDIWSLGCILLDMLNCSYLHEEEAIALLGRIKESSLSLENALRCMRQEGTPISAILLLMLQIQPTMRPTAR
ncbi:UNVERIFIED_CONTAM: hypothetical protein K2H54_050202 [Gekko kuhli]